MCRKLFIILIFIFGWLCVYGDDHAKDHQTANSGEFDVAGTLFHHVLESHNWHLADIPMGDGKYYALSIPLPWIVYNPQTGLEIFFLPGHTEEEVNQAALARGYEVHHEKLMYAGGQPGRPVLDLSISKTALQMIIVAILMFVLFRRIALRYQNNPGSAPQGLQSFFEPIIIMVRDDIAKASLQDKYERFMPYLLTLFFFIWFSNLFGLTPLNSNIAGNISITAALAVLTFLITNFNGTRDYWEHIFWTPGVPLGIKFILIPIEIVGVFTKPFSLAIRLFANIIAGHFMVLSLICLIFILGKGGQSLAGATGILPVSFAFSIFIMSLEFLVAVIQAFVFTLLTAVFIGQALESHSHESHEHEGAHH